MGSDKAADAEHARARVAGRHCRLLGEPSQQRAWPVLSGGERIVAGPIGGRGYVYELRLGDEVVATGHLSRARPLEVGERVSIGGRERSCARSSRCWAAGAALGGVAGARHL